MNDRVADHVGNAHGGLELPERGLVLALRIQQRCGAAPRIRFGEDVAGPSGRLERSAIVLVRDGQVALLCRGAAEREVRLCIRRGRARSKLLRS